MNTLKLFLKGYLISAIGALIGLKFIQLQLYILHFWAPLFLIQIILFLIVFFLLMMPLSYCPEGGAEGWEGAGGGGGADGVGWHLVLFAGVLFFACFAAAFFIYMLQMAIDDNRVKYLIVYLLALSGCCIVYMFNKEKFDNIISTIIFFVSIPAAILGTFATVVG